MAFFDITDLRSEALDFFVSEGVLSFGEFTLKSGRTSPYFFNTGSLCNGRQLAALGRLYAGLFQVIPEYSDATVIFGSAYKGIPIATATVIALQGSEFEDIRAVSDRKEVKEHGDASAWLGILRPGDKVVVVDDVITTGGTKYEAVEKLRTAGCEPIGLLIAFDRCEPMDESGLSARQAFERETGLKVHPLLTALDLIEARPDVGEKVKHHLESYL